MSNPKCIGIAKELPNIYHGTCDCGYVYEGHRDEWEYVGTDPQSGGTLYTMKCSHCGDSVQSVPGKYPESERKKLLPVSGE